MAERKFFSFGQTAAAKLRFSPGRKLLLRKQQWHGEQEVQ